MRRTLVVILALLAIAFAGASAVAAQQGDENLPCTTGGHWILSPWDSEPPVFDSLTLDKVTGKAVHYLSGPVDATSFAAIAAQHEDLKLSHCLEDEASQEPSIEPSQSTTCWDADGNETECPRPCFTCLPDTAMEDPLNGWDLLLFVGCFIIGYALGTIFFNWLSSRLR